MITPELVAYIKKLLTEGKDKESINIVLKQQGGWTEQDFNEAFASIQNYENITTPNPAPQKSIYENKSRLKWFIILLVFIGLVSFSMFFFIHISPPGINSVTGQVKMLEDYKYGSNYNNPLVLKKDTIVEVSKEYFLPQILLPGTVTGLKRFDTPPPIYTKVEGGGPYFSSRYAFEVTPFKGKLREGALINSLSLGRPASLLIVGGVFILLLVLFIIILNKIIGRKSSEKTEGINTTTKSKKISLFIPILLGILLLSSVPPFSYVTLIIGMPLQKLSGTPQMEQKREQDLVALQNKANELFPLKWEFCGNDEDCKKLEIYNEEQQKKQIGFKMNYRNQQLQQTPNNQNINMLKQLISRFAGQITIIFLAILFASTHLIFSRKKTSN